MAGRPTSPAGPAMKGARGLQPLSPEALHLDEAVSWGGLRSGSLSLRCSIDRRGLGVGTARGKVKRDCKAPSVLEASLRSAAVVLAENCPVRSSPTGHEGESVAGGSGCRARRGWVQGREFARAWSVGSFRPLPHAAHLPV